MLANLPRWAASTGAYHRQADVSVERMARLLPDRAPMGVVDASPLDAAARPGPVPHHARSPRPDERAGDDALRELAVCGLTATHAGGGGIYDIDLTVPRGSLTAITGPVGAGKSTLLRCLLGLAPLDHGELRWNGQPVDDPSQVLVPPRAAYVAQVPRLFSEPLSDAILLGVEPDGLSTPCASPASTTTSPGCPRASPPSSAPRACASPAARSSAPPPPAPSSAAPSCS